MFITGDCIIEKVGGAGLIAKGGRLDEGAAAAIADELSLFLRGFL